MTYLPNEANIEYSLKINKYFNNIKNDLQAILLRWKLTLIETKCVKKLEKYSPHSKNSSSKRNLQHNILCKLTIIANIHM